LPTAVIVGGDHFVKVAAGEIQARGGDDPAADQPVANAKGRVARFGNQDIGQKRLDLGGIDQIPVRKRGGAALGQPVIVELLHHRRGRLADVSPFGHAAQTHPTKPKPLFHRGRLGSRDST
jgi:hypothetical protein